MDALVLAAGLGKRMAPLTPGLAKPLLSIVGRSLLHRMLDSLDHAGIVRAVVVLHHEEAQVRAHLQAWQGRMAVVAVRQTEPRGTGDAVSCGTDHLEGDAIVVMADSLIDDTTVARLVAGTGFIVAAAHSDDARRYGVLATQGAKLTGLREKDPAATTGLVNTGCYRVPSAALQEAKKLTPSPRGELEFTDIVAAWAAQGRVTWTEAPGWRDVGAPWDLLTAQDHLLPSALDSLLGTANSGGPGIVEDGVQVRGRLYVAAGAIVKSGTYIEGDVWVGPGARVGPHAYLRGPTCIGEGCHVGASTEIKASLLMAGANAPHLNYVGDSVLGPGVNLGAGTVVANLKVTPGTVRVTGPAGRTDSGRHKLGAIIGPDAKIGIGCCLQPGAMVGAGALIGAGKIVSGWIEPGARLV